MDYIKYLSLLNDTIISDITPTPPGEDSSGTQIINIMVSNQADNDVAYQVNYVQQSSKDQNILSVYSKIYHLSPTNTSSTYYTNAKTNSILTITIEDISGITMKVNNEIINNGISQILLNESTTPISIQVVFQQKYA